MSSVRVRFAPSPTGFLHIGNMRTALFNYLFARHHKGRFILRIEDTDRERSRAEYAEGIIRDLKLTGIEYDEGPFYQSERLEVYADCYERLKKQNQVYFCYCTQEELEARRRQALLAKRPPRYDNRCRTLSEAERASRIAQGILPTVRFKVESSEPIVVDDLIRGEVAFQADEIGDFVIMRPDPDEKSRLIPTFHLSVCVDDGLMSISHVIRGEDHLSNSPRHVLLFQALGFPVPKFAHLSLIHGQGGEPLSKRYGAVSIGDFIKQRGYLAEALRNYLALLGWSPKDNREVFDPAELIAAFDLEHATRHPAIFSEQKLLWINGEHLRRMSEQEYLGRACEFLDAQCFQYPKGEPMDQALLALRKDIHRFDELLETFAFLDHNAYERKLDEALKLKSGSAIFRFLSEGKEVVAASAAAASANPNLSGEALFNAAIQTAQKERPDLRGKKLFLPLRIALTGSEHGMELKRIFQVLDREEILRRLASVGKQISPL